MSAREHKGATQVNEKDTRIKTEKHKGKLSLDTDHQENQVTCFTSDVKNVLIAKETQPNSLTQETTKPEFSPFIVPFGPIETNFSTFQNKAKK